ncbi:MULTISPECIES: DUF3164 family protein [unclassified Paracoccus (in: a-proteobacteria)]|uniref:DUF3164 family protein n=1 Tax=unclassified Paracoccus (in: a-proteobacteria) TaxID=2688777 RepID=UPI001E633DB9|nr:MULTISPECIES: DUF3164 family protein [unclassified Paracoccus (in: a-proteobacteria)]UXU74337.1 DUF3164 family protein [Paracoccus sp. SMMA_5]UXU80227.1 DUF3164 family protein [Paracoccus sp. SMMA_5_TC]
MKDELAERLVSGAESIQKVMSAFKKSSMEEMYAAKALLFEKYGAKLGGQKGGFGIAAFDGSTEVRICVADRITFGPELQAAKALIDECIESWAEGADQNIVVLINDAFQVNKAGRIDTKRVLRLQKLPIRRPDGSRDERWEQAMQAISDALIVDETATYIRYYRRNGQTNAMELVNLDFSAL